MKETFIISYDIKESENYNYDDLFNFFKSFGTWAKITESLWAIKTEKTVTELRDHVKDITPEGSSIFITKSSGIAAWSNVNCSSKWLKEHY